jgi:hypothetical protein
MGWDPEFSEPILLPKGKKLANLRDAALFITKLPKVEHDAEEWQAAMEALPLVAELAGPTMFARIGVMRALHRHGPKVPPAPRRTALLSAMLIGNRRLPAKQWYGQIGGRRRVLPSSLTWPLMRFMLFVS